jgi:hypothetical protein
MFWLPQMVSWLNRNSGAVTAVGTIVIAVATVVYVVITRRLWKATNRAAEAAITAARAAEQQAKVTEATFDAAHRPYFAVSGIRSELFEDRHTAHMAVVMKNYGSVPLSFVDFTIEAAVDDPHKPEAGIYRQEFVPTSEGAVLPGDDAIFNCDLTERWLYEIIASGDVSLQASIRFRYRSIATGKEYEFRSRHTYNAARREFDNAESNMT